MSIFRFRRLDKISLVDNKNYCIVSEDVMNISYLHHLTTNP